MSIQDESRVTGRGSSKSDNYFRFQMDLGGAKGPVQSGSTERTNQSKGAQTRTQRPERSEAARTRTQHPKRSEAARTRTQHPERSEAVRMRTQHSEHSNTANMRTDRSKQVRRTRTVRTAPKRVHFNVDQLSMQQVSEVVMRAGSQAVHAASGVWNKGSGKYRGVFLMPVAFLYCELLLRIFNRTGVFQHLIYPLVFGIAAGLFFAALADIFSQKVNKIITTVVLLTLGLIFIVECLVKDSYQVYMTLSSIMTGAEGVVGGYSSSLFSAILHGIPKIILFLLPGVAYMLFLSKHMRSESRGLKKNGILFAASMCLFVLGIVVASHGNSRLKYTTQYDFNTATQNFGLVTSIRLDALHGFGSNAERGDFVVDAEAETEAETEEVVYGKNEVDIDFAARATEDSNDTIKAIDSYVASQIPSNQNAYTGLFKGKNLIVIAAEAFSDAVVSKELTPTIYRLMHQGFYFSDFYQPSWGGSTSTGEYSILTGLVPLNGVDTMLETQNLNNYYTIGSQMQRIGYKSYAFHDGDCEFYDRNLTHENLGYDRFIAIGNGLENIAGAWTGDETMFDKTLDFYMDQQPFNVYYMTISGHCTYDSDSEYVEKHGAHVRSIVGDKYKETTFNYLCYQYELECALTTMVKKLEDVGIADDTVICMTADHYPYGLENTATFNNSEDYVSDLYGYTYTTPWEQDHNACILWSGCLEHEDKDKACEISTPASSLDLLPTLANLFGLNYDSRLLAGRDVFSDAEPLVLWNDYSWKTDKGTYNSATDRFVPETGAMVDDSYVERINNVVSNKILFSDHVHKTNYYNVLFGNN